MSSIPSSYPFGHPRRRVERQFRERIEGVQQYLGGRLLDAGCGDRRYEKMLRRHCSAYVGLDRSATADVVADLNMIPCRDESFDTIVCFQVLDDFEEPDVLLNELFRVLKVGGYLHLSANQQWRVHDAPHDYYRFTPFGLEYRLKKAGLTVVSIAAMGGFWAYLANRLGFIVEASLRRKWQQLLSRVLIEGIHVCFFALDRRQYFPDDTQTNFAIARK